MLAVPAPLGRPVARRIRAVNAVVDRISDRYRTVHFDAYHHPSTADHRMWSVDRLHPSDRGHRLVAHSFAVLLRERGVPVEQLPALARDGREPNLAAQAWWLATGSAWGYRGP
jgi:hypothetical protein